MTEIVECHSEFEYAERPVVFTWEGQRLEIKEILTGWRTPNEKCFRVCTADGQIFELSYSEQSDEWHIHQT